MQSQPLQPTSQADINEAVAALERGELVAFPTETVYGLGADAGNIEALKRLYAVKGRPAAHPVIVHLSSTEQLSTWAREVPPQALTLAKAFWPGPLTLILPRAPHVLDAVTGGQDSVGLRVPNHPLALALLKQFGKGVAAPSANKFGRLSPTSAEDVRKELNDGVACVLDGGLCEVGIESTIVDFTFGQPRILRPGMILTEQIEKLLGIDLSFAATNHDGKTQTRAPGGLPSHYAPLTAVELVASDQLMQEVEKQTKQGRKVCVLSRKPDLNCGAAFWLTMPDEPVGFARNLYKSMRVLDRQGADLIVVEAVPEAPAWKGIADRLSRSAIRS